MSSFKIRPKTTAVSAARNFVKEAATGKVSRQVSKKQYIPGIYTRHHPSQCDHILKSRPIHLKQQHATDGKEMLQLVTQENVRDLLVPDNSANVYPSIWQTNELRRIKTAGRIVTKAERQARLEWNESEKRRLADECERRKQALKELDRAKAAKKMEKKIMIGQSDDEEGSAKILDRAFVAKQEETEEVKRANRLILATKCHVIRDAQIAEKHEIKRELREEDLRLERMMLDERDKALEEEDRRREREIKMHTKHAGELKKQLHDRELSKYLQVERIEEEAKAMAKAAEAIKLDTEKRERERRQQMHQVRSELQKSNELSEFFKSLAFEEQRIADMRAQEYMRNKQERDKQIEHEKRLAKEQKQREADRLLAHQTRLLEMKNEQDDMELRRNQEEKERAYRRLEKEAALKKKKQERELEEARLMQLEEVKRMRAVQIARDEADFQYTVKKLKDVEQRDKERQEIELRNQEKYRKEIISQMNEKEIARREGRQASLQEFRTQQEIEEQRAKNIQSIINRKISEMRRARIPAKFVKDVERQLIVPTMARQ